MKQKALIAAAAVLFITVPIALRVREDKIIRRLSDDEYCMERIREAYPGFSHIVLEEPTRFSSLQEDMKELIRHFELPSPSIVMFFIISLYDPEAAPAGEENHFYVGYLCLNGDVIELAYDALFL